MNDPDGTPAVPDTNDGVPVDVKEAPPLELPDLSSVPNEIVITTDVS